MKITSIWKFWGGVSISFSLVSCAYFNTYYNAQKYLTEVEKQIIGTENPGKLSNKTLEDLKKTVDKCNKILQKYPESRLKDDALFLMGKAYYYREEYSRAKESLTRLVKEEENSSLTDDASLFIILCNWKIGGPEVGRREMLPFIERLEKSKKGRKQKELLSRGYESCGDMYLGLGKLDSAVICMDASIKLRLTPEDRARVYVRIAKLAYGQNQYDLALSYYREVLKNSSNPEFLKNANLQMIKILRLQKKWEMVTDEVQSLLANEKFTDIWPQLHLELARLYESQDKISEAISRYKYVTQTYPKSESSAEAYLALGNLVVKTSGDYEEPKKYFSQVEKDSKDPILKSSGRMRVKEIEALIKARSDSEKYLSAYQEVSVKSGSQDEAGKNNSRVNMEAMSSESLEKTGATGDSLQILNNLANVLYNYGELLAFHFDIPDSGIQIFNRVLSLPENLRTAQTMFSLKFLYGETGDTARASKMAQRLIHEYPYSEYGEKLFSLQGDSTQKEDERLMNQAEELQADSVEKSLAILDRLLREYPSSRYLPHALLAKGHLYDYQLNNLDSALTTYSKLIEKFSDSEQAQLIKNRYELLLNRFESQEESGASSQ